MSADQHKPWTILFYLCGDNPLDGLGEVIERELRQVLSVGASPEAHVAVQRDGKDGCARWLLENGQPGDVERPTRWLGRAVDSASPDTLRDFLLWGLERCPSDCVSIVFSGAGVLDDRAIVGTPTNDPDRVFTICDDWPARSGLEIRELAAVLRDVCEVRGRRGGHPRLELVAFDMCHMQFLEVATELHDSVELLIGPQTDVAGWDYSVVLRSWLRALGHGWRPDARAEERREQLHALAERLVTTIGRSYRGLSDDQPEGDLDDRIVVSALDLTEIERVLGAVDTMSLAYMQALGDRVAWDARTAAVSRLGPLQENKSYDAHGIFREVSRALDRDDIDASIAAYAMRWMCQAEPRELLRILDVIDRDLTTWLLEDRKPAAARTIDARRSLLEQWVRPTHEEVRRIIDRYAGQPSVALTSSWEEIRAAVLHGLARELGFPTLERLSLVIVAQQEAWHERRRRKRAADFPEAPAEAASEPRPCAPPVPPRPTRLLTARELASLESDEHAPAAGLRTDALTVWMQILEHCATDDGLPPQTRGEFAALLRERKNARHLRRLVGRTRSLLAPPDAARPRRGRFVLAVHPPPPARRARGAAAAMRRSGLSLYRPRDLAELTRASYLALQFNLDLHWTALLTAIHLIADRPHQLWQVLSSLLGSARARGRQEVLAQLAGPDAVLRVGGQFKAFAPVPMVTLTLERDTQGNGNGATSGATEDGRLVYLSRLMSSSREAVIHEQRCPVNQVQLDRLLHDLDHAVDRESGASAELDALGSMLGEDILSVLGEHLERERLHVGDDVHLQLQLPRTLLHYPWEIVRDRYGTLGTRYAIARQVFLDVGLSNRQHVRRAPRRERLRVLIVGNPSGSSLPWASLEATQVYQTFRALQRESGSIQLDRDEDVFIDQAVSVSDMRDWLRSGRYDVVHFCGHARFDPRHPARSAWMLSDGPLEAEQIRNTLRQSDSPPWLVYANACSAGRDGAQGSGPDGFLQDVTGLASAFINAGVAAYMGPLWPIMDSPACDLARRFYHQLVVGRTTMGAALRDARTRLVTEGSYAWASLVLYGDSTATLMQRLGALLSSGEGVHGDADPRGPAAATGSAVPAPLSSRRTTVKTPSSSRFAETIEPARVAASSQARGPSLTPEQLRVLRSHVVNMREGRFSSAGRFATAATDVDAMVAGGLTAAWQRAVERDEPLHIVLWAHGGLIDEAGGLAIAHNQVQWWLTNRVYPIFFVWETGFLDSLQQILSGTRGMPRARDVWDVTTDLVIEAAARGGGVGRIWGAMKRSAELASDADGAGRYLARKLAAFCAAHPPAGRTRVALHAVGHSAGSIFHSHFLPAAFAEGVPDVESLHLLAPAVRTDTFTSKLLPHVSNEIRHVSLFTMGRDWEEDDSVGPIYRKSLLYLVSRALEPESTSPILGLETSLRADPQLTRLFGLDGAPSAHGEVVWSVTPSAVGRSASTSKTHGGFDNNAPTMNSVLRRVLGRADHEAIVEFPREAEERAAQALASSADLAAAMVPAVVEPTLVVPPQLVMSVASANGVEAGAGSDGRRRALCVGIDEYPSAPLAGCVADAKDWQGALNGLGFETTLLTNAKATRKAILDGLTGFIEDAEAGDVVVFQYAGHGTQLPDADGDDEDDGRDEAFCPIDMDTGAYVIDDDVRAIFASIKEGVNVTCFIDCCHSGSITRAAAGGVPPVERTESVRPRFIRPTAEMERAHLAFRKKGKKGSRAGSTSVPSATLDAMRQVVFSACQDREVAYESNGHGDFTIRAVELLRRGTGVSHEGFQQAVNDAFGQGRRQNPNLECAPAARTRALLQPIGRGAARPAVLRADGNGALSAAHTRAELAELLRNVATLIG